MELLVKFASQICHENINKLLDGAYLGDFDKDITLTLGYDNPCMQACHIHEAFQKRQFFPS